MLLSDHDLLRLLSYGRIHVGGWSEDSLQPASIDVRLDNAFRYFVHTEHTHIDPSIEQADLTKLVEMDCGKPYVLHPGEFVLGSTIELFELPNNLAMRLEGKSSLGRLGLLVHTTAGFIDPGFRGTLTLELSNVAPLPILLWPGMKIGQVCFLDMSSPVDTPYGSASAGSRYQDQRGPISSRAYIGFTDLRNQVPSDVSADTENGSAGR